MERLPYIDEHVIAVARDPAETWMAVLKVMCRDPADPATVPPGFALEKVEAPVHLCIAGKHPFARYRLAFDLAQAESATIVTATSWAEFPGIHGSAYRALVIGTGLHRLAVRRMLRRIAAVA